MAIRQFLFKGTTRNIRHTTLIQTRLNGGINLQDIKTKIEAYRLQYIRKIIDNKHDYPIAHYYMGLHITKHTPISNATPHHSFLPSQAPTFYQHCIKTLKQYEHLGLLSTKHTTKNIYNTLIKQKATPLYEQIKRSITYAITDFSESFQNIHKVKITPFQKQIVYRILFLNTPTSEGTAKRINRIVPCNICKYNTQETEEHIFYYCAHIQQTKHALTRFLNTNTNAQVDIYKAIFLNLIPKEQNDKYNIKIRLLALYRETLWWARLQATFNERSHTPNSIRDMYTHRITHIFDTNEWAAFERMLSCG